MEANYGNDELKAALDFEKRYRKRLDIGKSVALGIDLAANLLSTLARSRGASVTLNTNNAAALDNKIAESEQKLLQAQRDYFGAHTYERVDRNRGEAYHTEWTENSGKTVSGTYMA